jgi:hypothetical protein
MVQVIERDKSREKREGQYAKVQVAISRQSCWGGGGGGSVTLVEGVDIVKEGRRELSPSAS